MSKETMTQALEALNSGVQTKANRIEWIEYDSLLVEQAIAALQKALAEQPAHQEPAARRDHIEQRLLTWRQSFVNKSGDQLALDDFMDKRSLDDLIDFVCSQYTSPPAQRILELEALLERQTALLERQTARIVDLQTHIENFDGEDR